MRRLVDLTRAQGTFGSRGLVAGYSLNVGQVCVHMRCCRLRCLIAARSFVRSFVCSFVQVHARRRRRASAGGPNLRPRRRPRSCECSCRWAAGARIDRSDLHASCGYVPRLAQDSDRVASDNSSHSTKGTGFGATTTSTRRIWKWWRWWWWWWCRATHPHDTSPALRPAGACVRACALAWLRRVSCKNHRRMSE